jgi:hypothetical protein
VLFKLIVCQLHLEKPQTLSAILTCHTAGMVYIKPYQRFKPVKIPMSSFFLLWNFQEKPQWTGEKRLEYIWANGNNKKQGAG